MFIIEYIAGVINVSHYLTKIIDLFTFLIRQFNFFLFVIVVAVVFIMTRNVEFEARVVSSTQRERGPVCCFSHSYQHCTPTVVYLYEIESDFFSQTLLSCKLRSSFKIYIQK